MTGGSSNTTRIAPQSVRVSSRNQWFQRAEVLKRNRKKRAQNGQFLVEGVRAINALVASEHFAIEAFLHAPSREASSWARELLEHSNARYHLELDETLLDELSDKEDSSELLAIAEIPADDPKRLPLEKDALLVLSDRPVSPGNLGTLIRSCDALGAAGLIVAGRAADLFDPQTVRATAGSFFALPTTRMPSTGEVASFIEHFRESCPGAKVVGTSAAGDQPISAVDLRGPTLLAIGNETRGLSRSLLERCDLVATIPMQGSASSLNMATAGTVMLYEAARQRHPFDVDPK